MVYTVINSYISRKIYFALVLTPIIETGHNFASVTTVMALVKLYTDLVIIFHMESKMYFYNN